MDDPSQSAGTDRRAVLSWLSRVGMGTGLLAAYGTLAAFMGRFLYPARPALRRWQLVMDVAGVEPGESLLYQLPGGNPINVTRRGSSGTVEDFIALSSTCPHLGCHVHWESQNQRFFCPCHNGVFTPQGVATDGPPADAGQSLPRYPLKVEKGLLFIEIPLEQVNGVSARRGLEPLGSGDKTAGPPGPGHDPCLYRRPLGKRKA